MRLRQVALVTRDLEATLAVLAGLLELGQPFRDPQVGVFGLENAVLPLGDSFLELVSPVAEDASARRFLDGRNGEEAGYMVIFEADDVGAARARAEAIGIRVVWQTEVEGAQTIHLHPKDVGGAIVSFDHMTEAGSWLWAGPDWQSQVRREIASLISGVEISSPDPEACHRLWQGMIGEEFCSNETGDGSLLLCGGGTVRFADSRATGTLGLTGLDLEVCDQERLAMNAGRLGLETDGGGAVLAGGVWLRPQGRTAASAL